MERDLEDLEYKNIWLTTKLCGRTTVRPWKHSQQVEDLLDHKAVDVEGAFNNTSYQSITRATKGFCVDATEIIKITLQYT